MAKVTNPSEETYKIKNLICTKRKIGKIPPTHNFRLIKPKPKRKKRNA
jgi:hypothetical protein